MPQRSSQLTFTRNQLSELVGVSDEVLGFWIKNGLLVPTSGGGGRGSHRKFDFVQVHIATILREMRRFGCNIANLKAFAEILQRGVEVCAGSTLQPANLTDAYNVFDGLRRFRAGEDVTVLKFVDAERPIDSIKRVSAQSEAEVIQEFTNSVADDPIDDVVAFSETLREGDRLPIRLYTDLVYGVRRAAETGEFPFVSWLVFQRTNGEWDAAWSYDGYDFGDAVRDGSVRSGIFLSISDMFKELWGRPL